MASYLTTSVCGFSWLSDLRSFCSVSPLDRVGFTFIVHPQPVAICKWFLSFCRASEPCRYKSNQATPPAFEDYIWSPHQHKGFVVPRSSEEYHFGLDSTGGFFVIYSDLRGFTSVSVLLVKLLWEQKSKSLHFSADLHIMSSAAVQFTPKSKSYKKRKNLIKNVFSLWIALLKPHNICEYSRRTRCMNKKSF